VLIFVCVFFLYFLFCFLFLCYWFFLSVWLCCFSRCVVYVFSCCVFFVCILGCRYVIVATQNAGNNFGTQTRTWPERLGPHSRTLLRRSFVWASGLDERDAPADERVITRQVEAATAGCLRSS